MFCYTVAQSLECILRELLLWSNTSKEHPTFLMTVAELANIPLSHEQQDQLVSFHNGFAEVERNTMDLSHRLRQGEWYLVYRELVRLIQEFLSDDTHFVQVLDTLFQESQPAETVWQVLISHIRDEQIYMYRLMVTLFNQLYH